MKKQLSLTFVLLLVIMLVACSEKQVATKEKVQTVIVGTGTAFPNICFIDEQGNLTGYDVELVKEIDKRLTDYEFVFKTMDFSNLLVSLGSKKIDMIAHEMERSEAREKKFLYNGVAYNNYPLQITVLENNHNINKLADLKGKKVITTATSNAANLLKQINDNQENLFEITYAGNDNEIANQLNAGYADATISTPFAVDFHNQTSAIKEKVVGEILSNAKVYFMFNKDESKLSKEIDKVLQQIIDDGTLKTLSEKWLGADYSKESY